MSFIHIYIHISIVIIVFFSYHRICLYSSWWSGVFTLLFGASQPMFLGIDASHDSLNLMTWPVSDGLHDAEGSSAYHPWRSRTPDTKHTSAMPRCLMNYLRHVKHLAHLANLARPQVWSGKNWTWTDGQYTASKHFDPLDASSQTKWTVTHHQLASSLLSKNSTLVASDSRIGVSDPGQKAHFC